MPLITLCLLVAFVFTLTGVWLTWHAPAYRMATEEARKDGKINEAEMCRRLRLIERSGQGLTAFGVTLLVTGMMVGIHP
jgi:hypothetical protein